MHGGWHGRKPLPASLPALPDRLWTRYRAHKAASGLQNGRRGRRRRGGGADEAAAAGEEQGGAGEAPAGSPCSAMAAMPGRPASPRPAGQAPRHDCVVQHMCAPDRRSERRAALLGCHRQRRRRPSPAAAWRLHTRAHPCVFARCRRRSARRARRPRPRTRRPRRRPRRRGCGATPLFPAIYRLTLACACCRTGASLLSVGPNTPLARRRSHPGAPQAAQRGQKQGSVTAPEADDPLAHRYGDTELVQSQVGLGSGAGCCRRSTGLRAAM